MNPQVANVQRLQYTHDKFVGRRDKVEHVLQRVNNICHGEQAKHTRVFVVSGEVGIGKTWFLSHVDHKLQERQKNNNEQCRLLVYRLDLSNFNQTNTDFDPNTEVMHLLRTFAHTIFGQQQYQQISENSLPGVSRQVIDATRHLLSGDTCLVLLLDSVLEANQALLAVFEDYFLGPLAIEDKVVIVMAGRDRNRGFPWTTPELRFDTQSIEMEPFAHADIEKQLKNYENSAINFVDQIHKIGQGVPLATYWLAHDSGILQDGQPQNLGTILEYLLESIAPDKRSRIRKNLEALCVLNAFDDDRIMAMVPIYRQVCETKTPTESQLSFSESVEIRRELVHEALARYVVTDGAYTLDKYIRKLTEEYLKQLPPNRAVWRSLHQAALALYEQWAKKYVSDKERYEKEMQYHHEQLTAAS